MFCILQRYLLCRNVHTLALGRALIHVDVIDVGGRLVGMVGIVGMVVGLLVDWWIVGRLSCGWWVGCLRHA